MTFTQNSICGQYPSYIEAIRPQRQDKNRTTVCIPETIPSVAMHQNQKSAESAAPFTIICILLLCAVMLFLIINSFNAIQSVDEELSAMQSQLQTLNSQKEQYGTQLQQAYSSLDMEQAAERLGMEKAA